MPHPQRCPPPPSTRKRTERASPELEGHENPSQPKKIRRLAPSQSFADVLKEMPVNDCPSPANIDADTVNLLEEALVFQYTDIVRHPKLADILIFGVTEAGLRVLVHVTSTIDIVMSQIFGPVDGFLRFYEMKAMSWIEIPVGKFKPVVDDSERLSFNQVEFSASHHDMLFHPQAHEGPWSKSAPLRILSFDIEAMVAPDNGMPRYDHERIIQIGTMLANEGEPYPYHRTIFTLNTCSPIDGTEVRSFDDEPSMLMAWRNFLVDNDPDLIIGHNIGAFDIPQLILRSQVLNLDKFPYLGRLKDVCADAYKLPANKRNIGDAPVLAGRLQLDIRQHVEESRMARTTAERTPVTCRPRCDLNTISLEFLGEAKEEIHFMKINPLQQGGPEDRRQLAVYCLKDTHLPLRLFEKLGCLEESVEAARSNLDYKFKPFGKFLRNGRNRAPGWWRN
ncbi:DNA polymerase [Favolaschia claudopus]|uniref:DNA polymerase delta catalytic subunit n=1 Tax=Favolaschia claudopus TaxID=2862362 RepID=A0AAW0DB28_9AGAR